MQWIQQYISSKIPLLIGITQLSWIQFLAYLVLLIIVLAISILVHFGVKWLVVRLLRQFFKQSHAIFLHVIARNKTLTTVPHIISGAIFLAGIKLVDPSSQIEVVLQNIASYLALTYLFFAAIFIITRLIWSFNDYYEKKFDFAHKHPIYGYLKVITLMVWVIWFIAVIAYFLQTSPFALLTGIGAISAVFLLVFKDTLLGIVASVQVTASNIVRIGDRITIDKYNVDGDVVDIAINTVRIQNADNTNATVPTYALISEVVKNWRGIDEAGGRRIKRAICVDINSIIECHEDLLKQLSTIPVINKYIQAHPGEQIINLALYREYVLDYLKHNPNVNQDFVTMVRHLDPGLSGLPLEIYTFTKETYIVGHENVQADIFEHCFSALAKFELRILQYSNSSN